MKHLSKEQKVVFQKIISRFIKWCAVFIFLLHLLAIVFTPYLNHDVAYFLTAGQMLVEGARPYVDIIDTNPPMMIYISAIPALFSHLTKTPLAVSGIMFFFSIVILTLILFIKIIKYIDAKLTHSEIYLICIFWLFFSFFCYYEGDFGQREQLIFLFLAPFLVLRFARHKKIKISPYLAGIIAFMAFCAVAMKPYYALILVFLEIVLLIKYRHFKKPFLVLEAYVCVCLGFLFLIHFYLVPGMSSFYDKWLGFVIKGYSAYSMEWQHTIGELFYNPSFYVCSIGGLLLCILFLWGKRSVFFLSYLFVLFGFASLIFYVYLAKGWSYYRLPFYYGILTGAVLSLIGFMKITTRKRYVYMLATIPILILLLFLSITLKQILAPSNLFAPFKNTPFLFQQNRFTETIESLTFPDDNVLFLNTSVKPAFPNLTYTGRKHGGRFLFTYPLSFFFKNSTDYILEDQWKDDEAEFYSWLKEDIHRLRPKLIFINTGDNLQGNAPYFKISEYLRRKGFYETISSSYKLIGHIDTYEVYLLSGKL